MAIVVECSVCGRRHVPGNCGGPGQVQPVVSPGVQAQLPKGAALHVRMPAEMVKQIESRAAAWKVGRSEALRRLLAQALED